MFLKIEGVNIEAYVLICTIIIHYYENLAKAALKYKQL